VAQPGGSGALKAPLAIREGSARDRDFVLDLGRRTIASSVSRVRPATPEALEASYARLHDFMYNQSHVVLIAEFAGERVGFLALLVEIPDEVSDAPQGFIAYMAVEPQARRHHIATALLERAERIARKRGLPSLALMVTEENRGARELYARAGFVTERRLLAKML